MASTATTQRLQKPESAAQTDQLPTRDSKQSGDKRIGQPRETYAELFAVERPAADHIALRHGETHRKSMPRQRRAPPATVSKAAARQGHSRYWRYTRRKATMRGRPADRSHSSRECPSTAARESSGTPAAGSEACVRPERRRSFRKVLLRRSRTPRHRSACPSPPWDAGGSDGA